jgi:hypothetical protein
MSNHPNRQNLYTVVNANGEVQATGCSVREAAQTVMNYDSHDYDIRRAEDGNGFELWTSQFSRASTLGGRPLVKSTIYSVSDDEPAAEAEIFKKVIDHADWWKGCNVMTDAEYETIQAYLAAEQESE